VTCSGIGRDPHISPTAVKYQVTRIAKANNMSEEKVRDIIEKCTDSRFLGVFGEKTVNVLKVNLMLDGIL
jgi:K+-transporting ATPase ATPase C chain